MLRVEDIMRVIHLEAALAKEETMSEAIVMQVPLPEHVESDIRHRAVVLARAAVGRDEAAIAALFQPLLRREAELAAMVSQLRHERDEARSLACEQTSTSTSGTGSR